MPGRWPKRWWRGPAFGDRPAHRGGAGHHQSHGRRGPGGGLGTGTVVNASQFRKAARAGARFGVSPGLAGEVAQASGNQMVPIPPVA
ncbi:MAG: hypothetical protein ACRD4E_03830 [Bryobacteraceae bacterium]